VKRGPDVLIIGLMGVSTALVLLIVFLLLMNNQQGTATTSQNQPPAGDPNANQQATGSNATMTAIAFTAETANLARISPEEAKALYDVGNATIIDVRPREGYNAQHIKGAKNIPFNETQSRLAEYPRTGNVIVYCQ
jgi:hypothetical protein